MGLDAEIDNALEGLLNREAVVFTATVISVDKQERTCEVVDVDDLDHEVRLSSAISEGDRIIKFPKVGSSVLVGLIGDDLQTLYVCAMSEVESIEGSIETTSFLIDSEGYKIDRAGENLNEVISDLLLEFGKLCDQINLIQVSIGTTPDTIAISQIKNTVTQNISNRLNNILK